MYEVRGTIMVKMFSGFKSNQRLGDMLHSVNVISVEAVSYTHLDVYKRQKLYLVFRGPPVRVAVPGRLEGNELALVWFVRRLYILVLLVHGQCILFIYFFL